MKSVVTIVVDGGLLARVLPLAAAGLAMWAGTARGADPCDALFVETGTSPTLGRVGDFVIYDLDGNGPGGARPVALVRGSDPLAKTSFVALLPWDGRGLGAGESQDLLGASGAFTELASFDPDYKDSEPPVLMIGGTFNDPSLGRALAAYVPGAGIVESPFGTPSGSDVEISALASAFYQGDDRLLAGGRFTSIGGVDANNVAMFDGLQWSAMGAGFAEPVRSILVTEDKSPVVYAGIELTTSLAAGAVPGVYRFDGVSWAPAGVQFFFPYPGQATSSVNVLIEHDFEADSFGPVLVAGGVFFAGGFKEPGFSVATYNGFFWEPLPSPFGNLPTGAEVVVFGLESWDSDGPGYSPAKLVASMGLRQDGAIVDAGVFVFDEFKGWARVPFVNGQAEGPVTAIFAADPDFNGPAPSTLLCGFSGELDAYPFSVDGQGFTPGSEAFSTFGALEGQRRGLLDVNSSSFLPDDFACNLYPGVNGSLNFDSELAGLSGPVTLSLFPDLTRGADGFAGVLARSGDSTVQTSGNLTLVGGPGLYPAVEVRSKRGESARLAIVNPLAITTVSGVSVSRADGGLEAELQLRGNFVDITGPVDVDNGGLEIKDSTAVTRSDLTIEGTMSVRNSFWNHDGAASSILVGGELLVRDVGGTIFADSLEIYERADGTPGMFDISALTSSAQSVVDMQFAGGVTVGRVGKAEMRVGRDAYLFVAAGLSTFGEESTGEGTLRVDGSGSLTSDTGMLFLGTERGGAEVRFGAGGIGVLEVVSAGYSASVTTLGPGGFLHARNATVGGDVVNGGTFAPGTRAEYLSGAPRTAANVSITGSYTQVSASGGQAPGRLELVVTGASDGDSIVVEGPVNLGGELSVSFGVGGLVAMGNVVPEVPVVRSFAAPTGRFEVATFPGLPPGPGGSGRFLYYELRSPATRGPSAEPVVVIVEASLAEPPPAPSDAQNYSVGGAGTAAALGDLNNDGLTDVAVTVPDAIDPVNNPGFIVVLINGGTTGGFWNGFTSSVQIATVRNPSSISIADFDAFNGADIAVTSLTDSTISVLRNDGMGGFGAPLPGDVYATGSEPVAQVAGDFNADGDPVRASVGTADVAIANRGSSTVRVLTNMGGTGPAWGGLDNPVDVPLPAPPEAITTGDDDEDKWDDIVVPQPSSGTVTVLTNNGPALRGGAPTFGQPIVIPVGTEPVALVYSDLDLDGDNDIVCSNSGDGTVSVILNGPGTYTAALTINVGADPGSITAADLDGDLDPDLAVVTTDANGTRIVRIYRNDLFGGQLAFAPQADLLPGNPPRVLLAGDVTTDGSPDLVTVNASGVSRPAARGTVQGGRDVTVFTFETCAGDANNDRTVDMSDISAVLSNWLTTYSPGVGPGDATRDGVVDFDDITRILLNWMRSCDAK
ncbi:MAG: FG-GAP-like repeat-containing protein [Planctomycetota bacterium]|nr:FG-GAP-like repeat-containing protein [Planctomycetota bacterium]